MPGFGFGKKICQWCVQHEAAKKAEAAGVEREAVQPVMVAPWLRRERRSLPISITQLLLGANVAVFVGMALAGLSLTNPTSQQLIHWGANFGPLTLGSQPWRLLTSCFVHSGIIHIGFNMWCLWSLGQLAEALYGEWTFAGIYLVSGVASMLVSALWRFGGVSVGASGAIFGVAGALAASFYFGEFSLPREAISRQLSSLVMFIGYNLLFGAVAGHIDNAAHLGGLVAGGILGLVIAKAAPYREMWPRRLAILSAMLGIVAASTFAFGRSKAYLVHHQQGTMLLQEGKIAEAIPELQIAARIRPDFVPTHLALAYAYWEQKNFPAAEDELKQIVAAHPNYALAYYRLGWLYRDMHKPELARAAFDKLLQLDPNAADGHVGLGALLADDKKCEAALQQYQTAAQIDPQADNVWYNMGLCYSELHRYDEAIAALQRQVQLSGEQSNVEAALAKAYRAKGMTAEAEIAEKKVSKLKPED